MAKNKLTDMQQKFVDQYLIDLNLKEAAIRAGYSPKSAHVLGSQQLAKPHVAAAIAAKMKERSKKTGVDAEWVLVRLKKNYRRSIQAESVLDNKGQPTGEYVYNGAVVNKALELIGKHIGMFEEKLRIDASVKNSGSVIFLPATESNDDDETASS